MKKKKRLIFFAAILAIPSIFLLHNINENFGLIPGLPLVKLLVIYSLVSAIVAALSQWLLKDLFKAFVFSFIVLTFYLLFGVFHDSIKKISLIRNISRYLYFIPAVLMILVLSFLVIRQKRNLFPAARFIAAYLVVNLVIESARLCYNIFMKAHVMQDFGDAHHQLIKDVKIGLDIQRPVVFWFVFDEYAASHTLLKTFHYKNPLDSLLRASGFFVANAAKSNYNFTHYSITSTLDMVYLDSTFKNHSIVTLKDLVRGSVAIEDNNVTRVFEKAGYGVNNFTIFPLKNQRWRGIDWFQGVPESLIDFQTMYGKLQVDIGWNFTHLFTGDKKKADSVDGAVTLRGFDSANRLLIQRGNMRIRQVASQSRPEFFMFHFMLPHEPYFYREDGTIAYENGVNYLARNYLEHLKYTNTIIKNFTDSIQTSFRGRDIVIIFQGDHGFKYEESDPDYDLESCNILYAVYCSDKNYQGWSNGLSSVNGFRILFNKYFHTRFPLLPDSSYNLFYR